MIGLSNRNRTAGAIAPFRSLARMKRHRVREESAVGKPTDTKDRIIKAADLLFYSSSIRDVSVDRVAEQAGVTKKTLYYHFRSKDDLIAASLQARHQPTLERYRAWAGETGSMAQRIEQMFRSLAEASKKADWKGCGFIRATVELADTPGHPALDVARRHKGAFESWLRLDLEQAGFENAPELSQAIMILLDGAVARMLLDRNPSYAAVAGRAARRLLESAQGTDPEKQSP